MKTVVGTPFISYCIASWVLRLLRSVMSAWRRTKCEAAPTTAGSRNVVRAISRQGTHQSALKSITTGLFAARACLSAATSYGSKVSCTLGLAAENISIHTRAQRERSQYAAEDQERTPVASGWSRKAQKDADRGRIVRHQPHRPAVQHRIQEVHRQPDQDETEKLLDPREPLA